MDNKNLEANRFKKWHDKTLYIPKKKVSSQDTSATPITIKKQTTNTVEQENDCTKKDARRQNLDQQRIDIEKPNRFLERDTCSKRNSSNIDWKYHIKKSKSFHSRNICDYQSKNIADVKNYYIRKHTDMRCFSCSTCGKKYKYKYQLNRHIEEDHKKLLSKLTCTICWRKMATQENLEQHLQRHEDVTCKTCNKKLKRENLNAHMQIHGDSIPCPICEKTFFRKLNMYEHFLIHTGKKHYNCDVYGNAFFRRRSLQRHMKQQHDLVLSLPTLLYEEIIRKHLDEIKG